ncbi:PAAR domain-containing protein [Stenotrophomonas maltophilia]|uniref:PAAR domain-containing protein n=1 Tax=Stenotrophomonas maltophilia TaxID=40324 RepID=UPI00223C896E|nr:PAAR domain-containing protein [Stenotrophomonas maltophilia]
MATRQEVGLVHASVCSASWPVVSDRYGDAGLVDGPLNPVAHPDSSGSGPGTHRINGHPIAVLGDQATCPLHGGTFPFVEGDPARFMGGKPIVLEGHRLACGCHAIAAAALRIGVD